MERLKLHKESFLDTERYFRAASWAGPVRRHFLSHVESDIIKHYHVIEKGLAMPDFRPRFGQHIVRNLMRYLKQWIDEGGDSDNFQYLAAHKVVEAYAERHRLLGIDVSDIIPEDFANLSLSELSIAGGAMPPNEITEADRIAFDRIATSRHSVRNFDTERIPSEALVNDSIRIAVSAPSVCNRQTWRVHAYTGSLAQQVLSHQNGNRGFGHLIPLVLIVTSDMRMFGGGTERYQSWIEGGIFSMNLMLSLHARGISSVALNWSNLNAVDVALRHSAGIPDHERIAMLIGCGYAAPDSTVTCSPRYQPDHFVKWHGQQLN